MLARIVAYIDQDEKLGPGSFTGVAFVFNTGGRTDTYHLFGYYRNNTIAGVHGSGHVYVGEMVSPNENVGLLTTKGGYELPLRARRR